MKKHTSIAIVYTAKELNNLICDYHNLNDIAEILFLVKQNCNIKMATGQLGIDIVIEYIEKLLKLMSLRELIINSNEKEL